MTHYHTIRQTDNKSGQAKLSIKMATIHWLFVLSVIVIVCSSCTDAGNVTQQIPQDVLFQQIQSGKSPVIIDVRTPQEYAQGHVPGAMNIPHTIIGSRIGEIDKYKGTQVVLYCKSGVRAGMAEKVLKKAGFNKLAHLQGDMQEWYQNRFPIER